MRLGGGSISLTLGRVRNEVAILQILSFLLVSRTHSVRKMIAVREMCRFYDHGVNPLVLKFEPGVIAWFARLVFYGPKLVCGEMEHDDFVTFSSAPPDYDQYSHTDYQYVVLASLCHLCMEEYWFESNSQCNSMLITPTGIHGVMHRMDLSHPPRFTVLLEPKRKRPRDVDVEWILGRDLLRRLGRDLWEYIWLFIGFDFITQAQVTRRAKILETVHYELGCWASYSPDQGWFGRFVKFDRQVWGNLVADKEEYVRVHILESNRLNKQKLDGLMNRMVDISVFLDMCRAAKMLYYNDDRTRLYHRFPPGLLLRAQARSVRDLYLGPPRPRPENYARTIVISNSIVRHITE